MTPAQLLCDLMHTNRCTRIDEANMPEAVHLVELRLINLSRNGYATVREFAFSQFEGGGVSPAMLAGMAVSRERKREVARNFRKRDYPPQKPGSKAFGTRFQGSRPTREGVNNGSQ